MTRLQLIPIKGHSIFEEFGLNIEQLQFFEVEVFQQDLIGTSQKDFTRQAINQVGVHEAWLIFKSYNADQNQVMWNKKNYVKNSENKTNAYSQENNSDQQLYLFLDICDLFVKYEVQNDGRFSILIQEQSSQIVRALALSFSNIDAFTSILKSLKKYSIFLRNINEDFNLEKQISEGSQATVHKATLKTCGSFASNSQNDCINEIVREFLFSDLNYESYAVKRQQISTVQQRLQVYREVSFLNKLSKSPHINQLIIVYEHEDEIFLVLDYAQSGDLASLIEQKIHFPFQVIKRVMLQLLSAIDLCHKLNIVHRDLKPDNILIQDRTIMKVCLTDYGLSCLDNDIVNKSKLCGSPGFMAPEILKQQPFDISSDIFSLGCVFYNLITGRYLFAAHTMQKLILSNKFAYPQDIIGRTEFADDIPSECVDLLLKMLDRNPLKRPNAAQCLQHDLFIEEQIEIGHSLNCNDEIADSIFNSLNSHIERYNAINMKNSQQLLKGFESTKMAINRFPQANLSDCRNLITQKVPTTKADVDRLMKQTYNHEFAQSPTPHTAQYSPLIAQQLNMKVIKCQEPGTVMNKQYVSSKYGINNIENDDFEKIATKNSSKILNAIQAQIQNEAKDLQENNLNKKSHNNQFQKIYYHFESNQQQKLTKEMEIQLQDQKQLKDKNVFQANDITDNQPDDNVKIKIMESSFNMAAILSKQELSVNQNFSNQDAYQDCTSHLEEDGNIVTEENDETPVSINKHNITSQKSKLVGNKEQLFLQYQRQQQNIYPLINQLIQQQQLDINKRMMHRRHVSSVLEDKQSKMMSSINKVELQRRLIQ
eukprot:403336705